MLSVVSDTVRSLPNFLSESLFPTLQRWSSLRMNWRCVSGGGTGGSLAVEVAVSLGADSTGPLRTS